MPPPASEAKRLPASQCLTPPVPNPRAAATQRRDIGSVHAPLRCGWTRRPWHMCCDCRSREMSISPGQRIGRNLVLVRPIGQGGMATVWVAEARAGKRRVAVKILDAQVAESAQAIERFTSEASAMARIHSPFVPEIYECGRLNDGTPYTVMELLDGVDLDVHLRTHGVLSLRATARLVTQIGAALTEAHDLGIVHRDVKAENIFVAGRPEQLRAKLIDFGIAKIPTDRPGRHGTQMATMGTPAYMSPSSSRARRTSTRGPTCGRSPWSRTSR